jgi:hypothetical protein
MFLSLRNEMCQERSALPSKKSSISNSMIIAFGVLEVTNVPDKRNFKDLRRWKPGNSRLRGKW